MISDKCLNFLRNYGNCSLYNSISDVVSGGGVELRVLEHPLSSHSKFKLFYIVITSNGQMRIFANCLTIVMLCIASV